MRVVPTSLTAPARIWSSLPTWPSVTSTNTRSRTSGSALVGQQAESSVQRREQFGLAPGGRGREVLDRREAVSVAGLHQSLTETGGGFHPGIERQDGEPVGPSQGVDNAGGGPSRGDHLPAAHAAGAVQQEHDVLGPRIAGPRGRPES